MTTDFADAHQRHLKDADTLYSAQRWANADHLYGLSAECGLKALMKGFGMQPNSNGLPAQKDRKHINELIPRYEAYRNGHHLATSYILPSTILFNNWKIEQRYDHQVNYTQQITDPHKQGAEHVNTLINKALLDGLI
jgi:hypothetical protein